MKRDQIIAGLRAMAGNFGKYALKHIHELEERVKLLESPARNVIRLAEDEGVDTHALMNAYLKRAERQTQELHRLQQRVQELEMQVDEQARRVE